MTRENRQTELNQRIETIRSKAQKLQAEADRINKTVNHDYAFWTQPAYNNAANRVFSNRRERERARMFKAGQLYSEAKALFDKADHMERAGVTMAGDAAKARDEKVAACSVQVGQMVNTTHYGIRKVLKVNQKTVLVEGSYGNLKVAKEFIKAA